MSKALKQRTVSSLQWSVAETIARQGMQFGFAIILARLLTPYDFGVMALMVVFVGVSSALVDGGFGAALVQKADPNKEEIASVFYFNISVGAFLALALAASAAAIAQFFDTPVLRTVAYASAVNVFVTSFGVVQAALLVKALNLRASFLVTVLSSGVAGALAVAMAFKGYGVWSLVAQSLVYAGVSTILLWRAVEWRPTRSFQFSALAPMWRFGSAVMVSGILEMIVGRLTSIVIGRAYSVGELGIYGRAESTRDMASTIVSRTVTRVAFPVFSAAAENQALLLSSLRKTLRLAMYFNFPGMIALSVLAPQLIPLIYGRQWIEAVPLLQIVSLAGLLIPMCLVNLELLKSTGKTGLYFRAEMIRKALIVIAVLTTFSVSVVALAWGQVAAVALFFILIATAVGRLTGHGFYRQMTDLWQPATATAAMLLAMWTAGSLFTGAGFSLLLAQCVAGGVAYCVASWLVNSDIQRELLGHIKTVLARKLAW